MMRPTSVEPVKATLSTPGCSTSACALLSSHVSTLSTPGGRPTSIASSANASAVSGVYFAGLMTTVLPAASAGATFQANISSGKFHGMTCADDAAGLVVGKLGFKKLRPAGVVIEVARDERNVDVAALADRLAVVHRFENGEAARMLLHLARESVEIARALVAAERLPCWQSFARRGDGGIHVSRVANGDFGEGVASGRIAGWSCTRRSRAVTHAPPMNSSKRRWWRSSHWLASLGSSGAAPYSMV